jgi:hypothetical protein
LILEIGGVEGLVYKKSDRTFAPRDAQVALRLGKATHNALISRALDSLFGTKR